MQILQPAADVVQNLPGSWRKGMHSDGGHLIDGVARMPMASGRRQALFGVLLMLSLSLAPVVSAAAEITLSSNSMAQEASPDEAAEYTITVRNTGSDDVTVQLQHNSRSRLSRIHIKHRTNF